MDLDLDGSELSGVEYSFSYVTVQGRASDMKRFTGQSSSASFDHDVVHAVDCSFRLPNQSVRCDLIDFFM